MKKCSSRDKKSSSCEHPKNRISLMFDKHKGKVIRKDASIGTNTVYHRIRTI